MRAKSTAPAGSLQVTQRVLVADDNPVNQMVAALTLQKLGYGCSTVGTGRGAIDAWASGRYVAILMDCSMPEIDGLEATIEIRARERGGRIPIIAMTASDIAHDRRKCREAGMDGYLVKPLDTEKLVSVLTRVGVWDAPQPAPGAASGPHELPVLDPQKVETLRNLAEAGEPDPFPEIASRFLGHAASRVVRLNDELGSARLVGEAHSLRGMSGTIGAKRLAWLCADLERAAIDGQPSRSADLIDEIWFEFHRVQRALEAELRKAPQPPRLLHKLTA